jgi:hypothetical protein
MITIEAAESALRSIYLDSVIEDINTKTNPFLTMIGKNKKEVAGKDARATIRYGNAGSVGARAENGDLPVATHNKTAEISVPLKNMYGTFQISDKAIRASQNNSGAFSGLLQGEMENLISTAQADLNRMIYGNGRRIVAVADSINLSTKTVTIQRRYNGNIKEGDLVDIYDSCGNVFATALSVATVDTSFDEFTFTGTTNSVMRGDRFYVYKTEDKGLEMNGIDSIFGYDDMYNLRLSEHEGIAPYVKNDFASTPGVLNEDAMIEFMDAYEEHCQGLPADILLTHPGVRKALFENLREFRTNVDVTEMEGGFKGFSFNGIPMYADVKCKAGSLYALNSDSWSMHELCDWTWLAGDDGSVLRQIEGKPAYSATLVKYADLICDKPFIQGRAAGYSATKSKAA